MKKMFLLAAPALLLLVSSFTPIAKPLLSLLHDTKNVLYSEISSLHFVPVSIEAQYRSAAYGTEVTYSSRYGYFVVTAVDDQGVSGKLLVVMNKADNKCVYVGMSANLHHIPQSISVKSLAKKARSAAEIKLYDDCMCDCMVVNDTFLLCLFICGT